MKEEAFPSGVVITDTLLFYDLKGQLVAKVGEESDNLDPVVFEITGLPDGSYTLVALRVPYKRNLEVKPWVITGEDLLSTVSLTTDYGFFTYPYAVFSAIVPIVPARKVWPVPNMTSVYL